jgi:nucleotide-binding universal stress UspA family protein
MFKQILVAIDRSPANQQVFAQALSLAKAGNAKLVLLHVLSAEEEGSPVLAPCFVTHQNCIQLDQISHRADEIYARKWEHFKQEGLKLLRFFTEQAIAASIQTEFSQITSHPSSTICDFAQSCYADLIVMGGRGHLGSKERFLGSVSSYVVHHAPCSVLLVPTNNIQISSTENIETANKTVFV